jgi:peptide/nickel transport system permease protein
VTAYIIRRLLLMIPTFIGILIITFAVLRLQGPTLVEQMQSGAGGGRGGEGAGAGLAGERKAQGASKNVENYIDRFRRAGLDRPALINGRGFWSKDTVVDLLRQTAANGPYRDRPSVRGRIEKQDLWLGGRLLVEPLAAVLRDDTLKELHGPASTAFALCAYTSLEPRDLTRLSNDELGRVRARNEILRDHRIDYRNLSGTGFVLDDPDHDAKRTALLAVFDDPANRALFVRSRATAWGALLAETGFCDFMGKLFTGSLYSETRKDYVFSVIADRWYITFWLNLIAILIAWSVSIPLGIHSARRLGTWEDRATTTGLFLLWSLPSFFVGTLLLYHFCTDSAGAKAWFPNRGLSSDGALWLPTGAYLLDLAWHAFLPLLVLSYASFTALSRYMRANLLEQLNADYVRTARAKGVSDDAVVYRHAARNSLVTMVTLGAGLLSDLFGGVLVVELIFSIPGLGWLMLDAAIQQDAPLLMGSTVISVVLLLFGILVADILYAVVDPRLRSRYA